MDSGVFESTSKSNKFDDTILKMYRFKQVKQDISSTNDEKSNKIESKNKSQDTDDEVFINDQTESNKENTNQ